MPAQGGEKTPSRKRALDPGERELMGRRLRLVRQSYQLTQAEVARRMNLPAAGGRSLVRQYEVGQVTPGLAYVKSFAAATGISPEWILWGHTSPVRARLELPISAAALGLLHGVWFFEFKEVRLAPPEGRDAAAPIGIIVVFDRGQLLLLVPSGEYRAEQNMEVILRVCAKGGRFGGGLYWPCEELLRVPERDAQGGSWKLSYVETPTEVILERLCEPGQVDYSDAAARFGPLPPDVAGVFSRFKPGVPSPLVYPGLALVWRAVVGAGPRLTSVQSAMEKVAATVQARAMLDPDSLSMWAPQVIGWQLLEDSLGELPPDLRERLGPKYKRLRRLLERPS